MTIDQHHTENYSLFHGDNLEIMPSIPDASVDLAIYSPPFAKEGGGALYTYSSSERDFSNAPTYKDFFAQYRLLVQQIYRVTKPGCFSAVHAMDIPNSCNLGNHLTHFSGDIIRLHQELGFFWVADHLIWKEPLAVRNRTMAKGLAHQTIVENADLADFAGGDKLLMFRKPGKRDRPVEHPNGLLEYYGATPVPHGLHHLRGMEGDQKKNLYSHWIWRRYASCIWDDIRGTLGEFDQSDFAPVLEFEEAREQNDERHCHPLQLDVIARAVELRTNPGEVVLDPFNGVGSSVYQAVRMDRRGIGIDLKPTYYRQAVKNCAKARESRSTTEELFAV